MSGQEEQIKNNNTKTQDNQDNQVRYVQIRVMDIANGEGIGCAIYFQGCPYHCYNCFNPETWDLSPTAGKAFTKEQEEFILTLIESRHLKRITFLGGEPLIERNLATLNRMVKAIKEKRPDMKIWFFSGNTCEKLMEDKGVVEILKLSDILVDGPFIDKQKNFRLKFRGSENQRIIDLKKTFEEGRVILREDLMECR